MFILWNEMTTQDFCDFYGVTFVWLQDKLRHHGVTVTRLTKLSARMMASFCNQELAGHVIIMS
jgi:hypothetical protein